MASNLSSNVGRVINFPGRGGRNQMAAQMLRVALPIAATLAWRYMQSRHTASGPAETAKQTVRAAARGAGSAAQKTAQGAKGAAKTRHSARYYAVTALIAALENPTTRKLVISTLKLVRNFL